jgi:hypothetical protein
MGNLVNKRYGSPPQTNPEVSKHKINFVKDMKKHGIMQAINEIKKFNDFFDTSPQRSDDE